MPRREAELKARLLATFQVEAAEHVERIRESLRALGDGRPEPEAHALVEATFRELHTLKGAARSVGLRELERICQGGEAELSALSRAHALPSPDQLAGLQELLHDVERRLPGGGAAAPEDEAPAPAAETIRLESTELDDLLRRAEELLAVKLAAEAAAGRAERLAALVRRGDRRAAQAASRGLVGTLHRDAAAAGAAIDGLLERARRVRMMPAASVLDLFGPIVRDLAREQGKEVAWAVTGGELEVDRRVLERIKDPLIHLVRNAVDHGVERPAERAAAGKPPRARLAVSVRGAEGGRIELTVADDGCGIDAGRVRDAARRARLADGELSDGEALELVFRSGLSTRFAITDVSGHGLGLAIVKEHVEQLGGHVALESAPGAGTTVRLLVPATVTTFRGLLVAAGGQRFLLPLDAVERVERAEPATVNGRAVVRHAGGPLPAAPLAAVLGLPDADPGGARACPVVAAGGERTGLLVDEVLGEREGLVRELVPPLVRIRHVAAAGLLGGGELVLILRPRDLVAGARGRPRAVALAAPPARAPRVLVVDDAATTRAMERGLLEMAGYEVEVAADGAEAWEALERGEFDLVLSDVDMPRLDGFALTERIRAHGHLAGLPIVLVSALEEREDERRGLEAGANAYVVKSSFERSNLLEIVRRLAPSSAAARRSA